MTDLLTKDQVTARLRRTLAARAEVMAGGDGGAWDPTTPAPAALVPMPVALDAPERRVPRRALVAVAAATVVLAGGVAGALAFGGSDGGAQVDPAAGTTAPPPCPAKTGPAPSKADAAAVRAKLAAAAAKPGGPDLKPKSPSPSDVQAKKEAAAKEKCPSAEDEAKQPGALEKKDNLLRHGRPAELPVPLAYVRAGHPDDKDAWIDLVWTPGHQAQAGTGGDQLTVDGHPARYRAVNKGPGVLSVAVNYGDGLANLEAIGVTRTQLLAMAATLHRTGPKSFTATPPPGWVQTSG